VFFRQLWEPSAARRECSATLPRRFYIERRLSNRRMKRQMMSDAVVTAASEMSFATKCKS
jgi:hypothetical protein